MADVTAGSTRFETGVESCSALLPGPPEFWSYSSLREIGMCPRRYALARAQYPDLWKNPGYPRLPTLPALFGDIVHDSLDTLVTALVTAGCESPRDPAAVGVMRQLGGYTAIVEAAVAGRLARLEGNPRLGDDRRRRLERGLHDRVADARILVQTYLSKSSLTPGKPSSPAAGQEGESTGAAGQSAAPGRRALAPGTHAEVTLVSAVPRLIGRLDLLRVGESGADITDYKTGAEKPGHQAQLEMYALLWDLDRAANPGRLPVSSLTAAYPNRDVALAVPDEVRKRELEHELVTRIASADAELATAVPRAIPAADTCRDCDVRHLCGDYWSAIAPDPATLTDGTRFDCQGTVGTRNGQHSWWLHSQGNGRPDLLLQAPPAGPELTTGRRIRILGLRRIDEPESRAAMAAITGSAEIFNLAASGATAR